jgi:hypothetical protein
VNSKEVQYVGCVPYTAKTRNAYIILVGEQLGKQKDDDVKVNIRATDCKDASCMKQAQNHVESSVWHKWY